VVIYGFPGQRTQEYVQVATILIGIQKERGRKGKNSLNKKGG